MTRPLVALALAVLLWMAAVPCEAVYVVVRARVKTPNPNLSAAQQAGAHSVRGDIIDLLPNDFFPGGCPQIATQTWAYPNGGPYVTVYLPAVTMTQAGKYREPKSDGSLYRVWSFLQDNIPVGARNTLATTGCYETTFTAIKSYLYDKVNGVTE